MSIPLQGHERRNSAKPARVSTSSSSLRRIAKEARALTDCVFLQVPYEDIIRERFCAEDRLLLILLPKDRCDSPRRLYGNSPLTASTLGINTENACGFFVRIPDLAGDQSFPDQFPGHSGCP